MDISRMIEPAQFVDIWPLRVNTGTAAVLLVDGRTHCVLHAGKHSRGPLSSYGIPLWGEKQIVIFNLKESEQQERVELLLGDGSRPAVHMKFAVACQEDPDLMMQSVRSLDESNIGSIVSSELAGAVTGRVREALGGMDHDALIRDASLGERMALDKISVAKGLVKISRLLSVNVEPDKTLRELEDIKTSGKIEVAKVNSQETVKDVAVGRSRERDSKMQALSGRDLKELSRELGVPLVYLHDRDLYREQLQARSRLFEEAMKSDSFTRLATSMNMGLPDLRDFVQGITAIAPQSDARTLPLQAPQSPTLPSGLTSRLRFHADLDEVLDAAGVSDQVAGSTLYVHEGRDGIPFGDAVLVSLEPDRLRAHASSFEGPAESQLKLPSATYWHYVQYADDLAEFIEGYIPTVLPPRALDGIEVRVADLHDKGHSLEIRLAIRGSDFDRLVPSLIGRQGRQIKQLQSLLPYRRIQYVE